MCPCTPSGELSTGASLVDESERLPTPGSPSPLRRVGLAALRGREPRLSISLASPYRHDGARRRKGLGGRFGPGGAVQRLGRYEEAGSVALGRRAHGHPPIDVGDAGGDRGLRSSWNTELAAARSPGCGRGQGERDGLGPRPRGALGGALGGRFSQPRLSMYAIERVGEHESGRIWRALTFSTASG